MTEMKRAALYYARVSANKHTHPAGAFGGWRAEANAFADPQADARRHTTSQRDGARRYAQEGRTKYVGCGLDSGPDKSWGYPLSKGRDRENVHRFFVGGPQIAARMPATRFQSWKCHWGSTGDSFQ